MVKFIAALFATLTLSACTWAPSDEQKFAELSKRCSSASERILDNSADAAVLLMRSYGSIRGTKPDPSQIEPFTYTAFDSEGGRGEPVGKAKISTLDLEYAPGYLLEALFTGNDHLDAAVWPSNKKGPKFGACPENKYILVRSLDEATKAFRGVCNAEQVLNFEEMQVQARYVVDYAYGAPDRYDIRPFIFRVRDRKNSRVLATQLSYQLLRGAMHEPKNRSFTAWGGAQGVENCPLTPPDQVIKRVFR
ncbi:hypothetical protein [Solilutibacter oculi]|uniref:hypothetical protein n=1 Tax=Solilutibacter oculi TaxID=2698682 RepID=UPI0013A6374B|nr:hypothetical protein [Lysobacter oculi]